MSELNRVPPHHEEAEQSFLGAILIDPEALVKVGAMVQEEDFYFEKHQVIYEVMMELFEKHQPIDLLSMGNRLEERDKLNFIGGRSYLATLTNVVPTSSNIVHYAKIIQKKATLRRLISAAAEITKSAFEQTEEEVDTILDVAEQSMFNVSSKFLQTSFTPIRSVLAGAFERIDMLHKEKGKLRGITTGYKDLNNILGGLQRSDLVILAARPACGKTSLALAIMRYAAKAGHSVGLFSLEMSKEQLVDRLICAEANVDLWKLRTGNLSDRDDDFPRIGKALGVLSESSIYIDDTAAANVMSIRTKCRRLQKEHGLDMIIIDYLQLMEGRGKQENRNQEISKISRGLKQLARELNVPVLALSQLSRSVEMSKPAIPKLSHLRESGSIEQDADVVMFIYRKAADKNYRPDELTPEEKTIAEIHIAKHRNGPTGIVKLFFDSSHATFKNLERRFQPPPNMAATPAPPPLTAKN